MNIFPSASLIIATELRFSLESSKKRTKEKVISSQQKVKRHYEEQDKSPMQVCQNQLCKAIDHEWTSAIQVMSIADGCGLSNIIGWELIQEVACENI